MRKYLEGVEKPEKRDPQEAVKQKLIFLVSVKTQHVYSTSNIKFETFNFRGCSSENILNARL